MTRSEKYEILKSMQSIGNHTRDTYPSKNTFYKALAENRIAGNYDRSIRIVSNDPRKEYFFVSGQQLCRIGDTLTRMSN